MEILHKNMQLFILSEKLQSYYLRRCFADIFDT